MKHLLNDLSEEEKNKIREQHTGGKKIVIENFNKLVNTKLGDTKPLTEQVAENPTKDFYSTLIGYLDALTKDRDERALKNPSILNPEEFAAIKETRMYFESLRDGKTPQPLSKPAEIVKKYAMDETKKLSGEELTLLKKNGNK